MGTVASASFAFLAVSACSASASLADLARAASSAAAAIVAKVRRDQIMRVIEAAFPGYHLASHKGYSTPKHKAMVKELNHSIVHRMSFLKDKIYFCDEREVEQQSFIVPDTATNLENSP